MTAAAYCCALLVTIAVASLFFWLDVAGDARKMFETARGSGAVLSDAAASDEDKERAAKGAATALLATLLRVLVKFGLLFVAGAGIVFLADASGLVRSDDSIAALLDPVFILVVSALAVVGVRAVRRCRS